MIDGIFGADGHPVCDAAFAIHREVEGTQIPDLPLAVTDRRRIASGLRGIDEFRCGDADIFRA